MLDSLISGIISIAEVCIGIVEILIDLILWVVEMIANAPNFFNPVFIMNEIIMGVFIGIETMVKGVIDIFTFPKFGSTNKCKNAGEGLFGFRRKRDENGRVLTADNNVRGKNCIKPSTLKIIITMLCPPLGLFLHLGINSWFHILVCAFLTVKLYYFPGFLYALMHIIC